MNKDKFTILVVDDEKLVRKIIIKFMEHFHSATCYEAENGKKALRIYKEKQIDLVISDFNMPEMNGLELLHELIAYDKKACVIIASGNKDETLPGKAISQGAKDFLTKPLELQNLIASIKKICRNYIDKKEQQ